ncbi:scarecrow-like protein 22 isoform X1 [Olea europaea var. sylvestris]|uniref:scarecrow-like protein 22 isoform X1 n=1 Tax=Olea europaea var. sylvestris TaxID=158386 RepID=UPI000C1D56F0|nr:scarecrow-like protein 22 isoform X1 [Olea europaea var. sylvestris]
MQVKGMPLTFDFEGKGVLDLELLVNKSSCCGRNNFEENCFLNSFCEPISVLDTVRSPSGLTSSSTLSSSLGGAGSIPGGGGGAGSTDTADVTAVSGNNTNLSSKWRQDSTATSSNAGADYEVLPVPPSLQIRNISAITTATPNTEKCSMDEWESVLSESVAASPSQDQSIVRWIVGDVEDPSMGSLNKVYQIGCGPQAAADFEFNGGFGAVDQTFGADPVGQFGVNFLSPVPTSVPNLNFATNRSGNPSSNLPNNVFPLVPNIFGAFDTPQMLINQNQSQHPTDPSFFMPISYTQQPEQNLYMPPQAKRHNPGGAIGVGLEPPGSQILKGPFLDTGQELLMARQQPYNYQQPPPEGLSHQLQFLPHYLQQIRPAAAMESSPKPKMEGDEFGHCPQQQQQAIIDQLFKAAELVQTGNPALAQGILARLNHQLSPTGKPFFRAAFFCKEALQLLLHTNNNINSSTVTASPFSLIFKIGAYKAFSDISPVLQFANFTCNQALLEVVEGFDRIHIVDFDIGYGGQWASLMQELALRSGGAPSLKITSFASSSTHDQLELGLTRENLIQFANEINIAFEFVVMNIDALNSGSWSMPFHVSKNEVVAVNLPVGSLASYQLSVPLVLRFVKQLSPKIVVSVDRGCDRTDLPFPNHIIHALQSYSNLLESLDAVNVNMDALEKIERFLLQPRIEKIVMGRFRSLEKMQHWRTLFLSSGFSPITFSNFTESQADCLVKRTPVRGFQVEKRQSSLVLCWQRKELISASAWRC